MSGGKINFSTSNLKFDVDNYSQYTKKEYSNNFSNTTYEEIDYNVDTFKVAEEKVNNNNNNNNNSAVDPTVIANITSIISNMPNISGNNPSPTTTTSNIASMIPNLPGILGGEKTEPLTPEERKKKLFDMSNEMLEIMLGIMTGTYSHIKTESDIKDFLNNARKQDKDLEYIIRILNKIDMVENNELTNLEYRDCEFVFENGKCTKVIMEDGIEVEVIYEDGNFKTIIVTRNGENITIFDTENNKSKQFGGSQMVFSNNNAELLEDPRVIHLLEKSFPDGDIEDYELLLARLCNSGCGYTAMINSLFVEYQGREKEFEDKFGFPMYSIDQKGNIDYNYEYLIIDAFTYIWKDREYTIDELSEDMKDVEWNDGAVSGDSGEISTGTNDEIVEAFENFLKDKYGINSECYRTTIFDEDDNSWLSDLLNINISKEIGLDKYKIKDSIKEIKDLYNKGDGQIILAVSGYDLYDMDGDLYTEDGGGHAMYITGITKDGDFIVSSWGKQYVCKLDNADRIGYYYMDL